MVVFTCQHCGDPVKKPAVEKHYNTKCRYRSPHLTCVDCLKDFSGDYGNHNQCMTELQRYSAQGTVFKDQKGKKKQEMYIEMIQNILNSKDLTLSPVHRKLLEVCSGFENVPRRLNKFENFMTNVARHVQKKDIHFVFNIIEDAWKKQTQSDSSQPKESEHQGKKETDIQEKTKNNGENTVNKTDPDVCSKNKKKRVSEKSLITEDFQNSVTTDEKKNSNENEESLCDQLNLKPKKAKKKKQNDKSLEMSGVEEGNRISLNESGIEGKEDMHNDKSSKKKKEKHTERCLDSKDTKIQEENGSCLGTKEDIMLQNGTSDDIKENMNKVSKKQLKKQKKYEKYLAELDNVAKSEVNENTNGLEESDDIKKNKKKSKKQKGNEFETESLPLDEDTNAVNKNGFTTKIEGKKIKKRKLEQSVCDTPEKKMKEISAEDEEGSAMAVFNWGDVIMKVLQSQPDKELSLKKLGKKVVNEYQTVKQDHRTYEELLAKFNKKVTKIRGVRVLRDRAKLIE